MVEIDERRRELRIGLPIHCGFNVLSSRQEYIRGQAIETKVSDLNQDNPLLEGRDDLERFLLRLDRKLDLILNLLAERTGRKEYRHQARVMDISESGLGLVTPIYIATGSIMEIGLNLPTETWRTLDMAAETVWVQSAEGSPPGWTVGLKFTDILPQDQDSIVHYLFQKQREEIRRKKNDQLSL
ncbi:MAG: PilZ domain-containing protein [Thermodesulfobacteriota bacterium]